MNRPSVDPAFTFAVSLAISVILWYPTFRATLAGGIEITDSGIRYFLALAISWAGVHCVSAVVAMYASKPRRPSPPLPPPDSGVRAPVDARRHDDPAAAAASNANETPESNAA